MDPSEMSAAVATAERALGRSLSKEEKFDLWDFKAAKSIPMPPSPPAKGPGFLDKLSTSAAKVGEMIPRRRELPMDFPGPPAFVGLNRAATDAALSLIEAPLEGIRGLLSPDTWAAAKEVGPLETAKIAAKAPVDLLKGFVTETPAWKGAEELAGAAPKGTYAPLQERYGTAGNALLNFLGPVSLLLGGRAMAGKMRGAVMPEGLGEGAGLGLRAGAAEAAPKGPEIPLRPPPKVGPGLEFIAEPPLPAAVSEPSSARVFEQAIRPIPEPSMQAPEPRTVAELFGIETGTRPPAMSTEPGPMPIEPPPVELPRAPEGMPSESPAWQDLLGRLIRDEEGSASVRALLWPGEMAVNAFRKVFHTQGTTPFAVQPEVRRYRQGVRGVLDNEEYHVRRMAEKNGWTPQDQAAWDMFARREGSTADQDAAFRRMSPWVRDHAATASAELLSHPDAPTSTQTHKHYATRIMSQRTGIPESEIARIVDSPALARVAFQSLRYGDSGSHAIRFVGPDGVPDKHYMYRAKPGDPPGVRAIAQTALDEVSDFLLGSRNKATFIDKETGAIREWSRSANGSIAGMTPEEQATWFPRGDTPRWFVGSEPEWAHGGPRNVGALIKDYQMEPAQESALGLLTGRDAFVGTMKRQQIMPFVWDFVRRQANLGFITTEPKPGYRPAPRDPVRFGTFGNKGWYWEPHIYDEVVGKGGIVGRLDQLVHEYSQTMLAATGPIRKILATKVPTLHGDVFGSYVWQSIGAGAQPILKPVRYAGLMNRARKGLSQYTPEYAQFVKGGGGPGGTLAREIYQTMQWKPPPGKTVQRGIAKVARGVDAVHEEVTALLNPLRLIGKKYGAGATKQALEAHHKFTLYLDYMTKRFGDDFVGKVSKDQIAEGVDHVYRHGFDMQAMNQFVSAARVAAKSFPQWGAKVIEYHTHPETWKRALVADTSVILPLKLMAIYGKEKTKREMGWNEEQYEQAYKQLQIDRPDILSVAIGTQRNAKGALVPRWVSPSRWYPFGPMLTGLMNISKAKYRRGTRVLAEWVDMPFTAEAIQQLVNMDFRSGQEIVPKEVSDPTLQMLGRLGHAGETFSLFGPEVKRLRRTLNPPPEDPLATTPTEAFLWTVPGLKMFGFDPELAEAGGMKLAAGRLSEKKNLIRKGLQQEGKGVAGSMLRKKYGEWAMSPESLGEIDEIMQAYAAPRVESKEDALRRIMALDREKDRVDPTWYAREKERLTRFLER